MIQPDIVLLVCIPIIAALTGYLTNYVAVRMLFRPRAERRFLGFKLQGLVPRRRSEIARSVGETVEKHLVSHEDVKEALSHPDVHDRIKSLVDDRIADLVEHRLKTIHPMAKMFLKGETLLKARYMVITEVMRAIPPITEAMIEHLEERLDFKQLVIDKIESFDLDLFEDIVLRIASRELRAIELLGGVLGLFIGLLTDLLLLI